MCFVAQQSIGATLLIKKTSPVQDSTQLLKKRSKAVKFFKKILHHNDTTKQANKFIHQHHKLLKDNKTVTFSTDVDTITPITLATPKDFALDYEVFGWYPYWEKEYYKQLNFSLLSTIAYFSYEVDPKTGQAITTHDWDTTALIDTIRTYPNKRILLTVSNFGQKNNHKFLRNPNAVATLTANLIDVLAKRGADGVCIDFEGVAKKEKSHYTSFLLTLSNRLKKADKEYKIYITVPSVNWNKSIDFEAINQAVDRFVIMGYDYYGKASTVAGPVAPLDSGKTWEPYNLTNSIDYYINNGISSSKIILALPTYGSLWETKNLDLKSKIKKYIGSRTYSYIKSSIETNEAIYIEPLSKSAYSAYAIKGKPSEYRQCWFENDSSFIFKTQLIQEKKLKGLGIWALGYDKGYSDIWDVIRTELSQTTTTNSLDNTRSTNNTATDTTAGKSIISQIVNTLGLQDPNGKINTVEKQLAGITNYQTILLYTMSFLLFFGSIGFLIAIVSPNTRNNFFNDTALKGYYIAGLLLLAVTIFRIQNWIDNYTIIFILGFLLGVFALYIANKLIEKKRKNLP